jgi:hypothetical protein
LDFINNKEKSGGFGAPFHRPDEYFLSGQLPQLIGVQVGVVDVAALAHVHGYVI